MSWMIFSLLTLEKKKNIVSSKLSVSKVLSNFHSKRNSITGEDDWKKEIIHTAAGLIRAEIDELEEDRNYYPDISGIADIKKQVKYVPFYLRTFLYDIFKSRKIDMEIRIAAIGQSIMQQCRPKSLMPPMQFGLTMRVHNECPGLVNDLFKSGFCLSDHEALLFKACAAADCPDPFPLMNGKFGWIIGDNFDHNKITLTGHGTIHAMGLMLTETPSTDPPHIITRYSKDIMKNQTFSRIEIKDISKLKKIHQKIIFNTLPDIEADDNRDHLDMMWKISLTYKEQKIGWQGYMAAITHGQHTGKSSFHFLPMVDLDPNSRKCIYSVLVWGRDQCEKYGIIPMFTFDQPIWWNARQLKSQYDDLASIVLNLGAFHTDLSFLGTIGNIMKSTGLKQLLTLVYPENTVSHMLSGKAYYRALRGFFLVDAALNIFLIKNSFSTDDQNVIHILEMFKIALENQDENKVINDEQISTISSMFKEVKNDLEEDNPTGKLWNQFMELVSQLRASLRAQRTNNFKLYLKSLQNRLPYFPASGHNNYAKSVHIFIQDMLSLKDSNPKAYTLFNDGFFFVRRSDKYWAGLPSDLIIEQVLMASLKDYRSGLTHGRGLDEVQRLKWLFSRPAFAHLNFELDQLYGQTSQTVVKEQTNSRIKEDTEAILKILEYIEQHNPFNVKSKDLVDISTGISYPKANAHLALDIGNAILKKMNGVEATQYTFKKIDRIKSMGELVMAGKEAVNINPEILCHRLLQTSR